MKLAPEWQVKAKNKAEEILAEFYSSDPITLPVPIEEVIASYIGDVQQVTFIHDDLFGEGVSGFARKDMEYGWIIAINGKECIERQRFSSAHEMGHITLITNSSSTEYCSDKNNNWIEKLCDQFAGHILMPEKLIREIYRQEFMPYLEDIAKKFKVSRQVAEIQLNYLSLPFQRRIGVDISF